MTLWVGVVPLNTKQTGEQSSENEKVIYSSAGVQEAAKPYSRGGAPETGLISYF